MKARIIFDPTDSQWSVQIRGWVFFVPTWNYCRRASDEGAIVFQTRQEAQEWAERTGLAEFLIKP